MTLVTNPLGSPEYDRGTDWLSGDVVPFAVGTTNEGLKAEIRHGFAENPVKGGGSTFKVNRTEGVTQAEQDALAGYNPGGQNTDRGAIVAAVRGTAASELQVEGLVAHARNAGTSGKPDACAIVGMAWQRDAGAIGRAIAAYLEARNELAGGTMTGLEIQTVNKTGADHEVDGAVASSSIGLLISAGGSANKQSGAGIQFHHPNGWAKLDVGIVASSNDGGPIKTALIQDNSEGLRSLQIKGKHSKAAISVAKEAGGVFFGAEERTLAAGASIFEVVAPSEADPLYAYGSLSAVNLRGTLMRNQTATLQAFATKEANAFLNGTATGDSGFNCAAEKVLHLGALGKTSMVRVNQTGVGLNGATPVAKAAEIASPAETTASLKTAVDAIRTAIKNVGITA